jgi:predicted nucleic acid-binding protein
VIAFPETSFLCALYRRQDNTETALTTRAAMKEPLHVSSLVLFEFRQSVRWQTWLHRKDAAKGYGEREGAKMLADLQSDMDAGLVQIVPVDWAKVHSTAERLSAQHTGKGGHRGFDILHVATALELDAKVFLTFDTRQSALAKAMGLKARPG